MITIKAIPINRSCRDAACHVSTNTPLNPLKGTFGTGCPVRDGMLVENEIKPICVPAWDILSRITVTDIVQP